MAGKGGAGPVSDAFIAAFRIPNLLRRLFGEGSLTIAFIPVFTDYLTNDGKDEAFRLAGAAMRLLSILLVITAVIGIFLSPLIMKVVAFGFADSPETFSLSVTLSRIMFPYVIFICLVAFSMGVLNAFGHFAAPALAPVFLNLGMIGAMVTVSLFTEDMTLRVYGLAAGVLIGGMMQLVLQIPFLIKTGFYFWRRTRLFHPGLKRIGILMLPATFGAAVTSESFAADALKTVDEIMAAADTWSVNALITSPAFSRVSPVLSAMAAASSGLRIGYS